MKKLPGGANPPPQNAVVFCGDILPHRKLFNDSLSAAGGLTLIRCSEDRNGALAVCDRLSAGVLVAKQTFIQQLPSIDFVHLTNYGQGTHVLAILESETREAATEMLRIGCRGILPPRFSLKILRRAVRAVLDGEVWAPRSVVSGLLSDLLRGASRKEENGLTRQEERILELTVQGYKNSAIAEALFISTETVRWHKRRLNRKIGKASGLRYPQTEVPSRDPGVAAG